MPRIVSSIKKHITILEFWRALAFVLKRLESIAKYLTKLPLPFVFILYALHLFRSGLSIYRFFNKTGNKNLASTFRFLFAVFKLGLAITALILLGCGFFSLPSVLLTSFFVYTLLKIIQSAVVLFVSIITYLKINKHSIEQQWQRAQYQNNMTKHAFIVSVGLMFVLLTRVFNAGVSILIWSNPVFLLVDAVIIMGLIAGAFYLGYKIIRNKRIPGQNSVLKKDQITRIKKFLFLFGLSIVALSLTAAAPSLGICAIIFSLILLCAQDILLTVYYYFFPVYIPNPEPVNLNEEQLNSSILKTSRDYYQIFSPVYYLHTQVSEKFPHVNDVNKANKRLLLNVSLLKILKLRNKRVKIAKSGISRFFSSEEKLKVKEDYLLLELAWTLNTDNLEDLIELILSSSDLLENKRAEVLDLELQKILGHLVCLAEQEKQAERAEIIKPKVFYQSFWKKVGACEALSQAFRASRKIEEQLSLSSPSLRAI